MGTTSHSVEVDAPLQAVYNQWTQFEDFPHFMEGVEEVRQEGDKKLFWRAKIGGKTKEWEAKITEQVPDQRIAWESIDGSPNSGVVTFDEISPGVTQVTATIGYEPEGLLEKAGDALGIPSAKVEGDLHRFRDYLEEKGRATGGWRGEIGTEHGSEALPTKLGGVPTIPAESSASEAELLSERRGEAGPAVAGAEKVIEVPLSEEEIKVGKRTVEAGEVTLRKTVKTEAVNVPVELKREDLVIERVLPHEVGAVGSTAFQDEKIVVPLSREEAVVEKVTNVTGAVRLRKTEGVETETIQDSVRREEVEVDESGKVIPGHSVVKEEPGL
jgi:uncharacterized protein (TIGR02271 family)